MLTENKTIEIVQAKSKKKNVCAEFKWSGDTDEFGHESNLKNRMEIKKKHENSQSALIYQTKWVILN